VAEVDRDDLIAYYLVLKSRKVRSGTVDRIFVCLSTFYTFLMDEGYIAANPIPIFRRRYLRKYKENSDSETLFTPFLILGTGPWSFWMLKTGMRREELRSLDVRDVNLRDGKIRLKPASKRSNRILYIDEETKIVLQRWLRVRESRRGADNQALFLSANGARISAIRINSLVEKHAARIGLHDPHSHHLEDRFTPHCCRHLFTTHLIRQVCLGIS
jgi:integrase/recombinase XerD